MSYPLSLRLPKFSLWLFSGLPLSCLVFLTLIFPQVGIAQIIPDNTLPINSQVTPGCISGASCTINLGTVKGNNLFHSFSEFSIPTRGQVNFSNALDIENIFTRVTGSQISNIDGLIRTNGNANLFLLNPNGIIFGVNARLDINGSFAAIAAESFKFPDGSEFSSTNPQEPPLLTISVTPGLQYGQSKAGATISNEGYLTVGQNLTLLADKLNLRGYLEAGSNLTLSATDNLQLEGDFIVQGLNNIDIIAGGNIDIQGNGKNPKVDIISNTKAQPGGIIRLNGIGGSVNLQAVEDITLGDSVIDSSYASASSVRNTINIYSTQGSVLLSETRILANNSSVGNAGVVAISARDKIDIRDTSSISTVGYKGNIYLGQSQYSPIQPSQIIINASELFFGTDTFRQKEVIAGISINSRDSVEIINKSQVTSAALAPEFADNNVIDPINVGSININTNSFLLGSYSRIESATLGKGDGGNININAKSVMIDNGNIIFGTLTNSSGNGGSLTINADNLTLKSNASFEGDVYPRATGRGGNVNIDVDDTLLMDGLSEFVGPTGESTRITVGILPGGQGKESGDVIIKAGSVVIKNGAIIKSSAQGDGTAGKINITANNVEISGSQPLDATTFDGRPRGGLPSGLFTSGDRDGRANDITIETDIFQIADGAILSSRTTGDQPGGNITVNAKSRFSAINGGLLLATGSGSGNAGNISVNSPLVEFYGHDLTLSERKSKINSYINSHSDLFIVNEEINSQINFLLASALANAITDIDTGSGLIASTNTESTGNGGNINITTNFLSLKDGSIINTSNLGSGQAGQLKVSANQVSLNNGAKISAETNSGSGGDIKLQDLNSLRLANNSQISATTVDGSGGSINIKAKELIEIDSHSALVAEAMAKGSAGNVEISAPKLNIDNDASLSVSNSGSGKAGFLNISANQVSLNNGAKISAETNSGSGGDIKLQDLNSLRLANNSQISATTVDGSGGSINIKATELIDIDKNSALVAEAKGKGDAGDVKISTPQFNINNRALVSVSNNASGKAGLLEVSANQVNLNNGAQIFAQTNSGSGGGISLTELKSLRLANDSRISAATVSGSSGSINIKATELIDIDSHSALVAEAKENGNAGNVEISTPQLNLNNNALVSVSNRGSGKAGLLEVSANQVIIDNGAKILAETNSGSGGDIKLQDLKSLRLNNDSLISATTVNGKGGNVNIKATELIDIRNNSALIAEAKAKGSAGNVEISTPQLNLNNGTVSVSSPSGIAGKLTITTNKLFLNQGILEAETGIDGSQINPNINLEIKDLLFMQNNSLISAEAFNSAKGGNIDIDNSRGFIVAKKNSDITANASQGNGGNIYIATQGIFGMEYRKSRTDESDITASANFAVSITVDPYKASVELPISIVNASTQISSSCTSGRNAANQFIITGRGGLPSNPSEVFTEQQTFVEVLDLLKTNIYPRDKNISASASINTSKHLTQATLEAQGWIIGNDGRIHLVTEVPDAIHKTPVEPIVSCASPSL
jgi:filamentous hemagglutinin family protein